MAVFKEEIKDVSFIGETKELTLHEDKSKFIQAFIKGIYSNEYSWLREIISNAIDATVEARELGNTPSKVQVILKENQPLLGGEPAIIIKDNGVGMDYQLINEIYLVLGGTTKDTNNSMIGAYGIGRLSPLKYNSYFVVKTRKNREEVTFSVSINSSNKYGINILNRQETTESTGTTVLIPLNSKGVSERTEIEKFINKYLFFRDVEYIGLVSLVEDGLLEDAIEEENYIQLSKEKVSELYNLPYSSYGYTNRPLDKLVLLGDLCYYISTDEIMSCITSYFKSNDFVSYGIKEEDVSNFLSYGQDLIFKFKIGELKPNQSRENIDISYNKDIIGKRITEVCASIKKKYTDLYNKNKLDFLFNYRTWERYDFLLPSCSNLLNYACIKLFTTNTYSNTKTMVEVSTEFMASLEKGALDVSDEFKDLIKDFISISTLPNIDNMIVYGTSNSTVQNNLNYLNLKTVKLKDTYKPNLYYIDNYIYADIKRKLEDSEIPSDYIITNLKVLREFSELVFKFNTKLDTPKIQEDLNNLLSLLKTDPTNYPLFDRYSLYHYIQFLQDLATFTKLNHIKDNVLSIVDTFDEFEDYYKSQAQYLKLEKKKPTKGSKASKGSNVYYNVKLLELNESGPKYTIKTFYDEYTAYYTIYKKFIETVESFEGKVFKPVILYTTYTNNLSKLYDSLLSDITSSGIDFTKVIRIVKLSKKDIKPVQDYLKKEGVELVHLLDFDFDPYLRKLCSLTLILELLKRSKESDYKINKMISLIFEYTGNTQIRYSYLDKTEIEPLEFLSLPYARYVIGLCNNLVRLDLLPSYKEYTKYDSTSTWLSYIEYLANHFNIVHKPTVVLSLIANLDGTGHIDTNNLSVNSNVNRSTENRSLF